MNPLILLFKAYWMQLAALALCLFIVGLIGYQRHEIKALQRDNASLQATIDLTKAVGQAANEKADRIEQGSHAAVTLQAIQGQSELTKIKDYYEGHPIARISSTNGVCKPTTNSGSGKLPNVPIAAEESTSSGKDIDTAAGGQSLEYQCAITTSQYNTLYKSWIDACNVTECK